MNPARIGIPMPLQVAGKDNCEVGRVRRDCRVLKNGLAFWVFGRSVVERRSAEHRQIA